MSSDSLFPELAPIERDDPYAGMGQDARRTARYLATFNNGIHPATRRLLHADAAEPTKTGPGLRCRDCKHLWRKVGHFQGNFLKCEMTGIRRDVWSSGRDMRAWWPACRLFEAVES